MIKPSKLREDIYNLLDRVVDTGEPLFVGRKGKVIKISIDEKSSKLANLKKRKLIVGDPDDIVHMDWSSEWKYTE